MTAYVRPPQITEREVSHLWVDERTMDNSAWEDCGPCTALGCVLGSHAAPATHGEAEELRQDSGYGAFGGTNVPKLAAGILKRYGLHVLEVDTLAQLKEALTPGHIAFAIVQPSKLPAGHVLRGNVGVGFLGYHFIRLANEGAGAPWMHDPAAPGPSSGYVGVPLSWADLATCYVGGAGVLPLAVAWPTKVIACSSGIRPDPNLKGASLGTIPVGAKVGVAGLVDGASWSTSCAAAFYKSGHRWYDVRSINGVPVATRYPGHARVFVRRGAVKGG